MSNSFHFLIVDDSPLNLKVAQTLVNKLGFTVDTVLSAEEAIQAVKTKHYSLIFMDYLMPDKDGIYATKAIRALRDIDGSSTYYSTVPIIALTAETDKAQHKNLLECGMNDVIQKPISLNSIRQMISLWLNNHDNKERRTDSLQADRHHCDSSSLALENSPDNLITHVSGIDKSTLDALATDDDIQFYYDILKLFYDDRLGKIERLTAALSAADYEAYTVEAHRIKSESAMVGASQLSLHAKELEFSGKAIKGIIPNGKSIEDNKQVILEKTPLLVNELIVLMENIEPLLASCNKNEDSTQTSSSAQAQAPGIIDSFSKELRDKLLRYLSHAEEALDEKDYECVKNWLTEITEVLTCLN